MGDIINESFMLYKGIKKSLKLNEFTQLNNKPIQEDSVSIIISEDYHTSLIMECKKGDHIIAVNIELDREQITIFGGKLDSYTEDNISVENKTFQFNEKTKASKYFELILAKVNAY